MTHEEDSIQAAICLALSAMGVFYFHVPNQSAGKTTIQRAMRLKAMGVRSGISDLVLIGRDGRAYFLEIKTEKGRLSDSQRAFMAICDNNDWPYGIARSVDDAIRFVRAWRVV